jgi:hypothetical protein
LKIRSTIPTGGFRSVIGGVLASATLLVSMGIGAQGASAASIKSAAPSAFCTTIISYRPATIPNPKNLKSYRAWAKSLEPFYESLAKEAPNAATKAVLNEVVVVLKYYVSSSSVTKLDASVVKYEAKWKAGAKALATAIISCAKSLE